MIRYPILFWKLSILLYGALVFFIFIYFFWPFIQGQITNKNLLSTRSHLLSAEIDFKNPDFPPYVMEVSGLSANVDPWGRWTDANLGSTVIGFKYPFPDKFTIEIKAIAYGPNINKPTIVRVGNQKRTIIFDNDPNKIHTLDFDNSSLFRLIVSDGKIYNLKLVPHQPISPYEINPINSDTRKIGIGLISIKINGKD